MCSIFSGQPRERYASQTRSVRLGGHATSIRLEAAFWTVLEEISARQGVSLAKFLTKLHDEVLEFDGEATNFASLLRCACLTYIDEIRHSASAGAVLLTEAEAAFNPNEPGGGLGPRALHAAE
jgi:predicted DNA-binding ribbon-helix-helix protein